MKAKLIAILISCLSLISYSQDTIQDPYLNVKSFITFEIGIAKTYTDNKNLGNYNLIKKGNYISTNSGIFFTKPNLLKDPTFILNTKTGFFFNDNLMEVTDSIGSVLSFYETNFTLPLMIGIRLPINYNRPQDRFYKAFNMNVGGYIRFPFTQSLYDKNNTVEESEFIGDYMKFGIITEIVFTALNKEGKGHRIGLRSITDIGSIIKFRNKKFGIYPTYISAVLFYNFLTF